MPHPNTQPEELLRHVRVASPCVADWEKMAGDDKIRHCPECNLSVYNLSGMTVREAAHLILNRQSRLCVRFYRRVDGTMLTQDSSFVHRSSRLVGATLSVAMTVTFAAAQTTPQPGSPPLVQIDQLESGIVVQAADQTGAIVANAKVTWVNLSTQQEGSGVTDSSGNLRLMHLSVGSYSITVSSPGFKREETAVTIGSRQIVNVSAILHLGATTGAMVELTAAPDFVPPADAVQTPLISLKTIPDPSEESVLAKPSRPKPQSKSIFIRIWRRLGF